MLIHAVFGISFLPSNLNESSFCKEKYKLVISFMLKRDGLGNGLYLDLQIDLENFLMLILIRKEFA